MSITGLSGETSWQVSLIFLSIHGFGLRPRRALVASFPALSWLFSISGDLHSRSGLLLNGSGAAWRILCTGVPPSSLNTRFSLCSEGANESFTFLWPLHFEEAALDFPV